jgi:hypothetical protein
MNLDDFEPLVMLADGETFTGLGGCALVLLTPEEAEHVADDDNLPRVKARWEVRARTFDLEEVVKYAFAHGFGDQR